MTKLSDHRTSAGSYDGGIPVIMVVPLTAHSTGAVDDLGGFVAPCDLTLVALRYHVGTAATSSAAAFDIGTSGDPNQVVAGYVLNAVAAGDYEIPMTDATVITKTVAAGEYVKAVLAAATAVGDVALTAVFMPTSSQ